MFEYTETQRLHQSPFAIPSCKNRNWFRLAERLEQQLAAAGEQQQEQRGQNWVRQHTPLREEERVPSSFPVRH